MCVTKVMNQMKYKVQLGVIDARVTTTYAISHYTPHVRHTDGRNVFYRYMLNK
jgi:hypothetical protein